MKQNMKCVFYIFIVLAIKVDCQVYIIETEDSESPCPRVFEYQRQGNTVYGYVTLKSIGGPVRTVNLKVNFTVAARLPSVSINLVNLARIERG